MIHRMQKSFSLMCRRESLVDVRQNPVQVCEGLTANRFIQENLSGRKWALQFFPLRKADNSDESIS